jgi:hypothetical protein
MSAPFHGYQVAAPGLQTFDDADEAGANMSEYDRTVAVDHATRELPETARGLTDTVREAGVDVARTARDGAADVVRSSRDAGADVAQSVKDEARQVASTAMDQAERVRVGVKQRVRDEADRQHRQVTDRVVQFAQELYTMAGERPDTPAAELVGMLADRSRSFAEYLDQHGPEKVLLELQNFARRRPGTFILAAVAAGFVVGRLGKGMWQNEDESRRS